MKTSDDDKSSAKNSEMLYLFIPLLAVAMMIAAASYFPSDRMMKLIVYADGFSLPSAQ